MSEPHAVYAPVKLELFFTKIERLWQRDTLPDVRKGRPPSFFTVPVLFFAEGVLYSGQYHENGYFYTNVQGQPVKIFRGLEWNGRHNELIDGDATHWCYLDNTPHPNFRT